MRHSFNSCGGVCGALWTSVVFQQIPTWCLSQWWRREFVWWIGQNQWAPQFRSHQKDQFCCLALMTSCKALQDVNSQTLREDSKDNNSLLIIPGCCEVFVAILNEIIMPAEKQEKTYGQYFSTRVHWQTLRFYYELL